MGYVYLRWQRDDLHRQLVQKDRPDQAGVYKLTCPDCNKTYLGKTGRIFWSDLTNTKPHLRQIATLKTLQNISSNSHTLSAPSTTQCRHYNATAKGHTSIPSSDTTFMKNLLKTTTQMTNMLYPLIRFRSLAKTRQAIKPPFPPLHQSTHTKTNHPKQILHPTRRAQQ